MSERELVQAFLRDHLVEYINKVPETEYNTLRSMHLRALALIKQLDAENAGIRLLMNSYNLGGWTDSLRLMQENDRLHQVCRDAYEVWAGSEGIPVPVTCPEAYLLQLLEQMRDEVKKGL